MQAATTTTTTNKPRPPPPPGVPTISQRVSALKMAARTHSSTLSTATTTTSSSSDVSTATTYRTKAGKDLVGSQALILPYDDDIAADTGTGRSGSTTSKFVIVDGTPPRHCNSSSSNISKTTASSSPGLFSPRNSVGYNDDTETAKKTMASTFASTAVVDEMEMNRICKARKPRFMRGWTKNKGLYPRNDKTEEE